MVKSCTVRFCLVIYSFSALRVAKQNGLDVAKNDIKIAIEDGSRFLWACKADKEIEFKKNLVNL